MASTKISWLLMSPLKLWKVDGGLCEGLGTGAADAVRLWNWWGTAAALNDCDGWEDVCLCDDGVVVEELNVFFLVLGFDWRDIILITLLSARGTSCLQ
jgi:hypothetical protein